MPAGGSILLGEVTWPASTSPAIFANAAGRRTSPPHADPTLLRMLSADCPRRPTEREPNAEAEARVRAFFLRMGLKVPGN
jgi:hypothetical protein